MSIICHTESKEKSNNHSQEWRKQGNSTAGILWLSFQSSVINMSLSLNSPESVSDWSRRSQVLHLVQLALTKGPGSGKKKHGCQETTLVCGMQSPCHIWFCLSGAYAVSYHLHRKSCDKVVLCNKLSSSHFPPLFSIILTLHAKLKDDLCDRP